MKVYVITSGTYSDYCIEAVSLDRGEAEKKCAIINDGRDFNYCEIEEYDTDDIKVESKNSPKTCCEMQVWNRNNHNYIQHFVKHLTFNDVNKIEVKEDFGYKRIEITATFAKDIELEKARKIMLDRVAEFKAKRTGIG